jgi:hypothetical protein
MQSPVLYGSSDTFMKMIYGSQLVELHLWYPIFDELSTLDVDFDSLEILGIKEYSGA